MPMRSLTIRIPDELREKLEQEAKKDSRSLSNLIIKVLNEYIDNKPNSKKQV